MEFGIPVATMPQQGTHFGLSEIHELSDQLTKRFVETGDPSWLAAYPGAVVRARAVTMIGKFTGYPVESVVHMGGSITAGQGWVWATFDSRVKGLVASGSIGPFTKTYPNRPLRERLRFLSEAPDEIRQLFLEHRDPINYARRIDCPVLIATGSNDFAEPADSDARVRGRVSGRHLLGQISIEQLDYEAGRISCRVRVTGEPDVPNPKPKYAACFIDVRDRFNGRPGHVTTLIRQLPTKRE